MCLTGSITSENKGGGSDPLRKKTIVNPFFFPMASLKAKDEEKEVKKNVYGRNYISQPMRIKAPKPFFRGLGTNFF